MGTPIGLTFEWTQISGPAAAQIDNAAAEDPTLSFTQKGVYKFRVRVADGPLGPEVRDGKETLATITVRVKDPATDDFLLAHWDMEENGGNVLNDKATGYKGVFADTPAQDPNWVAGWIEGASPNTALQFHGIQNIGGTDVGGPVQVAIDPNVLPRSDPNFVNLQYEVSAAAWIKAEAVRLSPAMGRDPVARRPGMETGTGPKYRYRRLLL